MYCCAGFLGMCLARLAEGFLFFFVFFLAVRGEWGGVGGGEREAKVGT